MTANLQPVTLPEPMPDLTPEAMKAARQRLGYSQKRLGEMLTPPASLRTVASWEAGEFKPKSPRREQLMAILELEPVGHVEIPQIGMVGVPKHELMQSLLRIRTEVDALLSRL